MSIRTAFPTLIYSEQLHSSSAERKKFQKQLLAEAEDIRDLDEAGQEWSRKHYLNGFTSYASANELQKYYSSFSQLESLIDKHVAKFARALDYDLSGGRLKMTTCWLNIMYANTHHGLHIHPLSVVSGTYYLSVPKGASAIKFEDPRLPLFMNTPPRRNPCRAQNRTHEEIFAESGSIVLFESWLRHEVPLNISKEPRISISFNYGWE